MERTYDDRMFRDTFEHEFTWHNGFMRNVRRYGYRSAIVDPLTGMEYTYAELNREANRFTNALALDGVEKNDVVMTALWNCPAFIVTLVGPRKIGAILQPANYNHAPGELALLIDFNRPKVFVYSAQIRDKAAEAIRICTHKPVRVVMADNLEGISVPEGHISYEEYIKNGGEEEPVMPVRPHIYDEVIRFCTSGTTALPKSVPLNDIGDVFSAHDTIMQYGMRCVDRSINLTPWFHRGGIHCGGISGIYYVGASTVCMREFDAKKTLDWIEKYHINFVTGAPSSLEMLCRIQKRKPRDLSSLKILGTMGAPFDKNACMEYMEVLTPNIVNGYGLTETDWVSLLRPYDLPEGAGTIGASCIDDELRVVNIYEDRKAEPEDTVPQDGKTEGEVIIWAPEKSTYSYYNNPEMDAEKFYRGWVYTGDTAVWNEKSHITILGRKDDMMVVSGENIYPTQIEEAINEHPKVLDCIVTALSDRDKFRGSVPVAYVVPSDKSLTIAELAEHCTNSPMLSEYKRPRYFALVDSIPLTPTGKKMHYIKLKEAPEDLANGILKRK
ncbi:MAG: acyl--CoA ligase [Lachnospiraceae bacterium]|nr:acyl--CoA ligase [Lachnospiraceae bacterium]